MKNVPDELLPTEEQEQIALVDWLEWNKIKFTAIPNSTYTTSWNQKRKNKAMGVRSGIPDILCIIKGLLVFIELKRRKGGSLSKTQKEWIEELNKCSGVLAIECKGADHAIDLLESILKNNKQYE